MAPAPRRGRSGRDHDARRARAAAGPAEIGAAGFAEVGAALWRTGGRSRRALRPTLHVARTDLRAGEPPRRRLARSARNLRSGSARRRRAAEHLFLSPDARRLHSRRRRARGRLRRDSGRARQCRAATRPDRASAADRVLRDAGLPEDPARCRTQRRPRCVVAAARRRVGRRISAFAAGGNQGMRNRRLSALRHRGPRRDRLRDFGTRGNGGERGCAGRNRPTGNRRSGA